MHRSTHAIERDIATRRQIIADQQQQLAALDYELSTARALELAGRRRQGHITDVLARYESGEHIVCSPRAWWCRNGQLLGRASGAEMAAMYSLREQGVIEAVRPAS
ncbi:hypothetical protein [Salinicola rhizosphaerae]|uniref:Uncharacterized protein n=1 Tax=Salinicola rhizosphaerae TaxID=1443141 RepID=A0ABQ3EFH1_9GAMM|nr:hypothetical protein [Salinicola rhizosphaerae]GHB30765.1 hypothetical protein GCM10009038_31970 [Salinicola rhizosphaerae]